MKKYLALIAIALLATGAPARAQSDLTQDQVAAYVTLVKADRARNRGAPAEALAGYRQAQQAFAAIASKDPRWQPDVVKYRLAYCENEIEKLNRQASGAPEPVAPSSPASMSAEKTAFVAEEATSAGAVPALQPPANPSPELQAELAALRQRVNDLQQLAPLTGEVARLQQAEQDWQDEKQSLLRQVDQLKTAASEAPASTDNSTRLAEIEKENEQLRSHVEQLEKEATDQAQKDAADQAQRLEDMQKQLAALTDEKQHWQSDLQAVQQLAESRFREMTASAQQLEEALKEVSELKLAQEQWQSAQAAAATAAETEKASAADLEKWQADLAACQQARETMNQQVASLTGELETLKRMGQQQAEAPSPTPASENAGGLSELQLQLAQLGEQLSTAGRQLDESRETALGLLNPTGTAK